MLNKSATTHRSSHTHSALLGRALGLLWLGALLAPLSIHGADSQAGPTAQERAKELEARKAAIDRDIAALEARKKRPLSPEVRGKLNAKFEEIIKNKGYNEGNGALFQNAVVELVAKNEGMTGKPSAIDSLIAFSQQLAEQNTDLIVIPVENAVTLHAHKLVPGQIGPKDDIWPAYSDGLLALMKGNVEVIDLADPFADKLQSEGVDCFNKYDHHWSTAGILEACKILGERLQRYGFANEAADQKSRFTSKEVDFPTPFQIFSHNDIIPKKEYGDNSTSPEKYGLPATIKVQQVQLDGSVFDSVTQSSKSERIDPVLVMGDSNVMHLSRTVKNDVFGAGFPEHLSMTLGIPVARRDEANGGNLVPRRYADRFVKQSPQPRVVIIALTRGAMTRDWQVIKFPSANDSKVAPSASFVRTDNTTLGDWKGKYGKDGFFIVGADSAPPAYVCFHGAPQILPLTNDMFYKYAESGFKMQVMDVFEKNAKPSQAMLPVYLRLPEPVEGKDLSGKAWINHMGNRMAIDLKFQDAEEHQVALYLSDIGGHKNVIGVEVTELESGKVLDPKRVFDVQRSGAYAVYNVRGQVRFILNRESGGGPQVGGFFFDPVEGAPSKESLWAAPVTARIKFLSAVPDPNKVVYKDALTTAIFTVVESQNPALPKGSDFFAIQWVMQNTTLMKAANLKQGQEVKISVQSWDDALKADPKLESLQRIDDTEFNPNLPMVWIKDFESPAAK